MQSSLTGLESLMGEDVELEFQDYLNDPEFNERREDVFAKMEERLGDKPLARFT